MRTAALICLWVACDAGVKPDPPAPAKAPQKLVAPSTVNPDLAYLPTASDLIVHVDIAALRQRTLWSTYESHIAKLLLPDLECAYAPLHDVATVDVGVTIKTGLGVFVVRGIDRDKTLRCLHASPTVRFDGDFVAVTHKDSAAEVLTFVDATTMLMQRGNQPTRATLTPVVRDGDAPLRKDPEIAAAIKHLPPHADVTVVSRPHSEDMRSTLGALGLQFQYFYGSMDATDQPTVGVQLHFAMVLATPDQATQLTTMMQAQLKSAQVKQMFDRIEVAAHGDTMSTELGMSEAQVAKLVGLFTMMRSN